MGRHKRLFAMAILTAVLFGAANLVSFVLIILGIADLSRWLQAGMVLYNLFFAAIFTVWFLVGGIRDAIRLFQDLEKRKRDSLDNGHVDHD